MCERLKLAIGALALKAPDFALLVDIPKRSIEDYLGCKREPGAEALVKICTQSRVSAVWLLEGQGPMLRSEAAGDGATAARAAGSAEGSITPAPLDLSPEEWALLDIYRALDADAQREIHAIAEEKKRLRDVERQIAALRADLSAREGTT